MLFGIAYAHSWYPGECCSGQDCRELTDGDVLAVDGGWIVLGRWYRSRKDARPSPDSRFHACAVGATLRCFFVPQPST